MPSPSTNPFLDLDVTKLLTEFKLPGVDLETILATQRKNIEALTKANHLAIEGFQTVARRQAEILRAGIQDAAAVARDLAQPGSPEDRIAKQTALVKKSVESAIANARELAEIVTKAQAEAFEILNKRWSEGFDEAAKLMKPKSK